MPIGFDIYIDTTIQEVVRGFADSSIAALPKFVQGDTPTIRLIPLVRTANFNSPTPYSYLGTAGLSFQVAIGTRVGNSTTYYTQQFTWVADSLQQTVSAQLPLNTSDINTLIGGNSSGSAWFEVKYLSAALPTTILYKQIDVQAAVIKPGGVIVAAGSTPLSLEDANATFLKRKISGAIYLQDISSGQYAGLFVQNAVLMLDPPIGPSQPALPSGMAPHAPDPPRD